MTKMIASATHLGRPQATGLSAGPWPASGLPKPRAPLAIRRLRLMVFAGLMSLFIAMLIIGPEVLLPSQANDANTVSALSVQTDEVNSFDGYAAMAFIYNYTQVWSRYTILIAFAGLYFYLISRNCNSAISATFAVYVGMAPILLFLCFFVKDTMYIPFMVISALLLSRIKSEIWSTLFVALILLAYAFIFRQYFLIIAALFVGLVVFKRSSAILRFFIILSIPLILLAIPQDTYTLLQEQRDIVNRYRLGFTGAGTRTAFANYMPPDGMASFFVNYGYAVLRLNLPVLFGAGSKELFMMSNIAIYLWLAILALSSRDHRIWRPALLFSAHFLTLMLFEPDLGSYLRHMSTSLPLLAPVLALMSMKRLRPNVKFKI